jgi:hypothetical protein
MAAKKKSSNTGTKLLACIIAGVAIGGHHGALQHAVHATLTDINVSGTLATPQTWTAAFLAADGMPETVCNNSAVRAWVHAEGGGFGNQAENNPLNVNPGAGAGWPATGLRYTIATVQNYPGIQAALRAGDSAQAVCDAIMASPWAASHYDGTLTATC